MTAIEKAIRAVRAAESSAADVAGNMESALFLGERCGSQENTLQALEWAASNVKSAKFKIDEALAAVREMRQAVAASAAEGDGHA